MKISNMDIPVRTENNPIIEPDFINGAKTSENMFCRDPFIMLYNDRYYLYHTLGEKGIGCRVSEDLENWSASVTVFETPEDFHGYDSWFWAPECHYYNGKFYIFTSVKSKKYNNHRTISVYRADNPLGPFEDIADGAISPRDWDAIDGTLYIDDDGAPWMVFVHEWTCMPDGNGGMVAARLSEDFTHLISEPIELFRAKDPEWAMRGITDGPYLYTTDKGTLYMIWSNFGGSNGADNYVVGLAKSENGKIDGNWVQCAPLIYEKGMTTGMIYDGGHGMLFKTREGGIAISLHTPNGPVDSVREHLSIFPIVEENDCIKISK